MNKHEKYDLEERLLVYSAGIKTAEMNKGN